MTPVKDQAATRLDSWKEIAGYLGHDVRTVVRWEKDRGLPVHRIPGGLRNAVFAIPSELDAWSGLQQSEGDREDQSSGEDAPPEIAAPKSQNLLRRFVLFASLAVLLLLVVIAVLQPQRNRAATPEITSLTLGNGEVLQFAVQRIPLVGLYGFAVADLNHDGILDIVAANYPNSTVSVLMGLGQGRLAQPVVFNACRGTYMPAVADFDGDGIPDVAVTCYADSAVAILRGDGKGGFKRNQQLAFPCAPFGVHAVDFDHDGAADLLAICESGSAFVFRNDHGSLHQVFSFRADHELRFAAIGDFDGDGFPDFAIPTGRQADRLVVMVLFGGPDLKFRNRTRLEAALSQSGLGGGYVVSADFNHDGKSDVAVANGDGSVDLFLNSGNRSFSPPQAFRITSSFSHPVLVDLARSGAADLVVSTPFDNAVTVRVGRGDGTFGDARPLVRANYPVMPVVIDLNGDGSPDILFSSPPSETLVLVLSRSTNQRR
jgi:hypothetical protein